MNSPFSNFANATLIFSVPTGAYTEDDLGNQTPTTSEVTVVANLEQTRATEYDIQLGIDSGDTLFEGFLVNPLSLPEGINPLMKATATITSDTVGNTVTGTFVLFEKFSSPYVKNIPFLNKIRGAFKRI